mgnify:CR=1 FL=1
MLGLRQLGWRLEGLAVLEVEGAVAAPEKWPMLNVRRCVMVLMTMERACARKVVEGCD